MPGPYDPNSESTNEENVVAAHWECLRRNKEFRALSEDWVKSESFRYAHASSQAYHNMNKHTPRCAWDWMLTTAQRVQLARYQIEKRLWMFETAFNFGPVVCQQNFSPSKITSKNLGELFTVQPLQNAPPPVTIHQSWNLTPEVFKQQFRLAYRPKYEFGEVNTQLHELSNALRLFASKLVRGDFADEFPALAHHLFEFGNELRLLAEFFKVFKIPNGPHPDKQLRSFLEKIRESFSASNLIVPTKTYDIHKSFYGTAEDWRWYLKAEELRLDVHKSADCYKLAEIYSEDLRQRSMRGDAPRRTKSHGLTGSKFPSSAVKNRRSVVKRHVLAIEKWILKAFPPQPPKTAAPSP